MSKAKTRFTCQECGLEAAKWMGKCPACGAWNSMVEEFAGYKSPEYAVNDVKPVLLTNVKCLEEERLGVGIPELDRVLGGGFVPGSLVLLGGDPGIGKSTLLLQAAAMLTGRGKSLLYVSGEESAVQIKMRADRLHVAGEHLYLVAETNLDYIEGFLTSVDPSFLVVDSVQTIYNPDLSSAPGSVAQVRECTARLLRLAKSQNKTVLLVGHVTKEGNLAGPRVLEHMVDTVLYLEGERHHAFRILRSVKNRFGSTNEIGVFEMREQGLVEVANPSQIFLAERPLNVTGSLVVACMEGTRPLLLEIQALVSGSAFGNPRRLATGLDINRVLLMIAVLEKKNGLILTNQDIYLNVAGGVKIDEPAADLGICLAVASSHRNRPVDCELLAIGEVGLTGEVRAVNQVEKRILEGYKLGFKKCMLPANNLKYLAKDLPLEISGVSSVEEALEIALGG